MSNGRHLNKRTIKDPIDDRVRRSVVINATKVFSNSSQSLSGKQNTSFSASVTADIMTHLARDYIT